MRRSSTLKEMLTVNGKDNKTIMDKCTADDLLS